MNKLNLLNEQKEKKFFNLDVAVGSIIGLLPIGFILNILFKESKIVYGAGNTSGYGYVLIFITPLIILCCLIFLVIFSLFRRSIKSIISAVVSFLTALFILFIVINK